MKYEIKKRESDYFLITDETYKDQTIVINLSSIIKEEQIQGFIGNIEDDSNAKSMQKIDLMWILRYEPSEESLYVDLMTSILPVLSEKIDIEKAAIELVDCVKSNKMIDSCNYLNIITNKLYQTAFINSLEKNEILYSAEMLDVSCEFYQDKKIVGRCSRVIMSKNQLLALEYVGKKLVDTSEISTSCEIKFKNTNKSISYLITKSIKVVGNDDWMLGYYSLYGIYSEVKTVIEPDAETDTVATSDLKVQYSSNSTIKNLYEYVLDNNSVEQIKKYKSSMKPKLRLANVNTFMVEQFMV